VGRPAVRRLGTPSRARRDWGGVRAESVVSLEAWLVLALVAVLVAALARGKPADLVFLGGLTLLLAGGVLTPAQGLAGFSNEGVLSVAALFVVAAGVRETGALDVLAARALGRPRGEMHAQLRVMLPVAFVSAFIQNTPVVAVAVPVVTRWCARLGLRPGKLLMPLSYATILGGTCTLVGTSTNVLVAGLAGKDGLPLGMFEIAWIGLPVAAVGLAYIVVASPWLLPDRSSGVGSFADARAYGVTMRVEPGSPVVGSTIESAGLRHLAGVYLAEIERDGEVMPAVSPETQLCAGDRLLFVGAVDEMLDVRRVRGLSLVSHEDEAVEAEPAKGRRPGLIEAVVGSGSSLVGRGVRELGFRTRYGAAVVAVHRGGERLTSKVGDVVLEPGDTLLLEARSGFLERHGRDSDFALVAAVAGSDAPHHARAGVAIAIVVGFVVLNTVLGVPLVVSAFVAAAAMVATGCLGGGAHATRALDLRVLVTIAASFGVGEALVETGAAAALSRALVDALSPLGPIGVLAGVYVATALLTELVTNNAAAVLMYPIAAGAAAASGIDLRALVYIVMLAASASFATPIGYQTNLMVWGPGGYRFSDFVRLGTPLQAILAVVTVAVVAWRFT
jgi:di/tricarboxylate transporter